MTRMTNIFKASASVDPSAIITSCFHRSNESPPGGVASLAWSVNLARSVPGGSFCIIPYIDLIRRA